MTRTIFTVQAPAARASEALPRELGIGPATLHISAKASGRDPRRFAARWSKGPARGDAYVEIRPASKSTSEVVVALEPRTALGRLFGSRTLRRFSERVADALRYEIETRTAEEADAFTARRTTAALVRQRSA